MDGTPQSILALDVGSGTQDIFLWRRDQGIENCVQMVLPSPTALLARRVREATRRGLAIHLRGYLMGGGPVCWAIRDHAAAGLPVTAEREAALTLHDDLDQVREIGVVIQDDIPDGAVQIPMGDVQREALESTLRYFDLEPPKVWCVAVQDHGFQPQGSNRAFRFSHWKSFMDGGGRFLDVFYEEPPSYLTRMQAILAQIPGGRVMDTGMAAIQGALCDQWVRARLGDGVLVVNLGNQHTLAAMVGEDRVWGLFEHHTGSLTQGSLVGWLERFQRGEVRNEEVLEDGGHGCVYHPSGFAPGGFDAVVVCGPQREMARGTGWIFAAPLGNMMLAGCFGLISAFHRAHGMAWP